MLFTSIQCRDFKNLMTLPW